MEIIKITAMWCSSCIVMENKFKETVKPYNLKITEYDYDFDEQEILKYNVGNILPVYILVNNNTEIKRFVGESNLKELKELLEERVV